MDDARSEPCCAAEEERRGRITSGEQLSGLWMPGGGRTRSDSRDHEAARTHGLLCGFRVQPKAVDFVKKELLPEKPFNRTILLN